MGKLKHRLYGNYKWVNECITHQNFPLPQAEDLLDKMKDSTVFTVIDLQAACLQLPLRPEDREKMAIFTPDAMYQFLKLPFGLSIAAQSM